MILYVLWQFYSYEYHRTAAKNLGEHLSLSLGVSLALNILLYGGGAT
jgi:hypothetical protein